MKRMKRTMLAVAALLTLAAIAYAAEYKWECILCKSIVTTSTAAQPSTDGCSKAGNGKHVWVQR